MYRDVRCFVNYDNIQLLFANLILLFKFVYDLVFSMHKSNWQFTTVLFI